MTLRIRELIIRAEIGSDKAGETSRADREVAPDSAQASESGSMTRRFFEEDIRKDNER